MGWHWHLNEVKLNIWATHMVMHLFLKLSILHANTIAQARNSASDTVPPVSSHFSYSKRIQLPNKNCLIRSCLHLFNQLSLLLFLPLLCLLLLLWLLQWWTWWWWHKWPCFNNKFQDPPMLLHLLWHHLLLFYLILMLSLLCVLAKSTSQTSCWLSSALAIASKKKTWKNGVPPWRSLGWPWTWWMERFPQLSWSYIKAKNQEFISHVKQRLWSVWHLLFHILEPITFTCF